MSSLVVKVKEKLNALSNNSLYRYYCGLLSHFPVVANDSSKHAVFLNNNAELMVNSSSLNSAAFDFGAIKAAVGIALRHPERRSDICKTDNEARLFNIASECVLHFLMKKHFTSLHADPHFIEVLDKHYPMNNGWNKDVETIYTELLKSNQQASDDVESGSSSEADGSMSGKTKHTIKKALEGAANAESESVRTEVETQIEKSAKSKSGYRMKSIGVSPLTSSIIKLDPSNYPVNSLHKLEKLFFQEYSSNLKTTPIDSMLSQRNLLRREFLGEAMMGRKAFTAPEATKSELNRFHNSVLFLVDVSGSMNEKSINRSMALIKDLAVKYKVTPVEVKTYNTSLSQSFTITENTDLNRLVDENGRKMFIGGGTNISNVLGSLKNTIDKYKVIMILTDLQDNPVRPEYLPKHTKLSWLVHDESASSYHANFGGNLLYINDLTQGGKCEITTLSK